jgi:hypothetical protein
VWFRGATLRWGVKPIHDLGWGALVEQLDVIDLVVASGTNVLGPPVRFLARRLADELDAAGALR